MIWGNHGIFPIWFSIYGPLDGVRRIMIKREEYMKRILCCFLLWVLTVSLYAQEYYTPQVLYRSFYKTIPLLSSEDPLWVKELYNKEVNVFQLEDLYLNYFRKEPFKKSIHTQNYKYFMHQVKEQGCYNNEGMIVFPSTIKKGMQAKSNELKNENDGWECIGPFKTMDKGGIKQRSSHANIFTIAQSTLNSQVVYAGGETGGVFKSVNKGTHWEAIGGHIFDQGAIDVVQVDPTDERVVYVGAGHKLYKSEDGGENWSVILTQLHLNPTAIVVHDLNPDIIMITGETGLFRSENGGESWEQIISEQCWDIQLKTDDANTVFLVQHHPESNSSIFLKSIDGGISFERQSEGWYSPLTGVALNDGGTRIAVTNADPNRVYAMVLGEENDAVYDCNYIGIYRSDDAGESWYMPYDSNLDGERNNEPGGPYGREHWCLSSVYVTYPDYEQGFYNVDIAVSDENEDLLLIGALNLYKSENGGASYKRWGGYNCNNCGPDYKHPDIQEIEMNGDDVWVASDGGIDYYDKNLNFIRSSNEGITGTFYWGADQGWNEDIIIGGRFHNGDAVHHDQFQTGTFLYLGGAEAATGYLNRGENRKAYFSDMTYGVEVPDVITDPVNRITTYELFPNENSDFALRSEVVSHPKYWNILYSGRNNSFWRSTDGGEKFEKLYTFGNNVNNRITGIEISRGNPDIILVLQKIGDGGTLWKTNDGGLTWNEISLPVTHRKMTISLNEQNELYFALNTEAGNPNKIFKTTDFGVHWENLTTSTIQNHWVGHLQVQEGTNGGVYLATDKNIWYRNNDHTDWQLFSSGLPLNIFINKLLPFYKEGKLRIASSRGIWERPFFEASQPRAQPMASDKYIFCKRDEIQFEDHSILNHQNASWKWEFPGALSVSSTTVRNPLVRYENPGEYEVRLKVTNALGQESSKTETVMVTMENNYCSPLDEPLEMYQFDYYQYLENENIEENDISHFSFTAWLKPQGNLYTNTGIFNLVSGGYGQDCALLLNEGNNTLGFMWNGQHYWLDSNLELPADEWSYVALTVSPDEIRLYLNEEKVVWNIETTPINITKLTLGTFFYWGSRYYKGKMEEARFWKRTLTDKEIWETRHLTTIDDYQTGLFAWYQFNNLGDGLIYDVYGNYDLSQKNGGRLLASDAPIGSGVSETVLVHGQDIISFEETGVSINAMNTGYEDNSTMVVTKLNILPTRIPSTNMFNQSYWIINNYGSNDWLNSISELKLNQVGGINQIGHASSIRYYNRSSNSGRLQHWEEIGMGSQLLPAESAVMFNGIGEEVIGQVFLGEDQSLSIQQEQEQEAIMIYPNPARSNQKVTIGGKNNVDSFLLTDANGKIILNRNTNGLRTVELPSLRTGIYFYSIATENELYQGKLCVE